MSEPFDPGSLDPDDPFEIDEHNEPHLYKHAYDDGGRVRVLGEDDLYDVFWGRPRYRQAAHGPAVLMMIGRVPGGEVFIAPLAPSKTGDPRRLRPIGLYRASRAERLEYQRWLRGGAE